MAVSTHILSLVLIAVKLVVAMNETSKMNDTVMTTGPTPMLMKEVVYPPYRYVAFMRIHKMMSSQGVKYCGATPIAPEWVLTAASCVEMFSYNIRVYVDYVNLRGLPNVTVPVTDEESTTTSSTSTMTSTQETTTETTMTSTNSTSTQATVKPQMEEKPPGHITTSTKKPNLRAGNDSMGTEPPKKTEMQKLIVQQPKNFTARSFWRPRSFIPSFLKMLPRSNIAVVKLTGVKIEKTVRYAGPKHPLDPSAKYIVVGYGYDGHPLETISGEQRNSTVKLLPPSKCSNKFRRFDNATMICAEGDGTLPCYGYIGAPILQQVTADPPSFGSGSANDNQADNMVVVGVISNISRDCNKPFVATRVSAFSTWIKRKVK